MRALLIKEFLLCLHPTQILFLTFACFVFILNYPYEIAFCFSGLSVFFACLSARENGDATFSCTLPVRKRDIATARILFCVFFQIALLLLTAVTVAVKQLCLPVSAQNNLAGSCANLALLGHGCMMLAVFNLIFFPQYFKNPVNVGIPFLAASAVQFLLVAVLVALRFSAPVYSDLLVAPDPQNMGVKAAVFGIGATGYAAATVVACALSAKRFEHTDL